MRMGNMPSQMSHQFSRVPHADIPRSSFNRTHKHKTTFDAGYLVPILCDEMLPGDTFNVDVTAFARLATPIFPIMDNMRMDTQFFAVPYRLVWENWQRFHGEQDNPGDSTDFTIPQIISPVGGYTEQSIYDYLGLPTGVAGMSHSALPLRAVNLIYNEWYRDQNMQPSLTVPKGDGPDDPALYNLFRRGKRHDYFTSCLPWPQKGPGVQIPLGEFAPVRGFFTGVNISGGGEVQSLTSVAGSTNVTATPAATTNHTMYARGEYDQGDLYADLSEASAATINSLRQAFQIQKVFERDARGGTRYTEMVRAHFRVTSPDARLQRPEYLGGGSTDINLSPIPQTSATGAYADSPQGNLSAVGTATFRNGFTYSATEHVMIIGFVSVRGDLSYQQGLDRMWSRLTRFDFFLPALSHIGEQAVLQKEIFCTGIPAQDDLVFGYQERFAEYRYKQSLITGRFRSQAVQSLDSWHLAQDFATAPVLDATFIEENIPLDRCIAVNTEPHFLFDSYIKMRCSRPIPLYGDPGLIDHF